MNKNSYLKIIISISISIFFVSFSFYFQGNIGINLADEGFLWYGVQRVMSGEIPIRDFMSYDPGRYYWSAALMSIINSTGIMQLRFSVAIFQMLGLFCGILAISWQLKRNKLNFFYLIISAFTKVSPFVNTQNF
jgi:hypothetical protein